MKITVIAFFTCIFSLSAIEANSQNAKVSIQASNFSIRQIIQEIEKQTDYLFVYDKNDVNIKRKVSLHTENEAVSEVLNKVFEGTDISYALVGKNISLRKQKVESTAQVVAQQTSRKITGTILDTSGLPIIGGNIMEKGTSNGTTTDIEGKFELTIQPNATLTASFIGYIPQEIKMGNKVEISVVLVEDAQALDEVVVVGYGTMKKRDLTGAVSSVKSETLRDMPSNNIAQALQGRVPGVQIQQNSGAPGSNMQIRIRGANSISGDNEPLWIINGFPGDQSLINSSDIESIEVLKDASATAIYGSRGANGVIIVTTKQGKEGRASVDYEGSFSLQTVRKKLDFMNATEYATYYNEYWKNIKGNEYFTQEQILGFGKGTDWQDLIFHSAPTNDHAVTVTGGTEKTQFSVGASYYNQEGIIKKNDFQKIVLRANINHKINEKFSVAYNSILSRTDQALTDDMNVLLSALSATPTVGPLLDDGNYRLLNGIYPFSPDNLINPVAIFNETSNKQVSNKVMASLAVIYNPIKDLSIKISGNISNTDNRSDSYKGVAFPNSSGQASIGTSNGIYLNSDNIVTYNKVINESHTINATGAITYESSTNKSLSASGSGFLSDATETHNIGSATTINTPWSSHSNWTLLSYLARINYSYNSKYMATMSFRADGSSRYSKGSKWGYFPSGALAWRISEENFMKNINSISDAKLRIGYGLTGSTAISPYYTLNMLTSGKTAFNDGLYTYFSPGTRLPSDLKWETTSQIDVGLDLSLFNSRLRMTVDYYIKNTRDLLNAVQLPASLGYTTTIKNIGKVRNKGFELHLDANIIDSDFKWDLSANISFNRNKVVKLNEGQDIQGSTYGLSIANDYVNILREGLPMSVFYGYETDGFDDQGHYKYKDRNKDGAITEDDKSIMGDPNPDFTYGLSSTFSWRNFEFSFFIQGSQGNDIYSLSMINQNYKTYIGYNALKEVFYNHWTPQNTQAKYPAADNVISTKISDDFVFDGSYLRLKNIKLAYNIPIEKLGINGISRGQIYISGQNLLTITNYPWWDPEVNSKGGGSSINQGIDHYSYPTAKGFTFGVKLSF